MTSTAEVERCKQAIVLTAKFTRNVAAANNLTLGRLEELNQEVQKLAHHLDGEQCAWINR